MVGAGIVGASIAFHLARRGVDVTVVEGNKPGTGASGRSFAYINSFWKPPLPYHDLNRRSMDMWDRFARRLGTDVGLRWGGKLRWESTTEGAEELHQRVRQLQAWGYPSRIIDEAELRRLEPELRPGTVAAAVLNENDGHVDPTKVIQACLKGAQARGAAVHIDTPVTGLSLGRAGSEPTPVESVQIGDGEIPCDVVVLAAGVGTTALAATAGIDIPQQESPGVVIRTDPRPQVLHTASVIYAPVVADSGHSEFHLCQTADGSLIIGGDKQESLIKEDSQEHAEDLLARATHYFPILRGATAIPLPVAYRPMPVDGLPVLGFTESVPNLYLALMHSGVTLAPIVGELSAMEIVDGTRVEMLDPYRPERLA